VPRIIERCLQAAVEYSKRTTRDQTKGRMIRDHRGVAAALRALAAAVAVDADAVFGPDLRLLCPAAETALAVATKGHVGGELDDIYDIESS
jgi:alkylation response protein AidB-like acyl-CoA dehydrogenase